MSEFEKENQSGAFEKNDAVDAFEDFEMSQDEMDASADTYEVFDEIEETEEYTETTEPIAESEEFDEFIEEADKSDEETEADDEPEEVEEPVEETEAGDESEEVDEPVEEAEDTDEPEAVNEPEVIVEPVEEAEDTDEPEAVDEPEEIVEPVEETDDTDEPEASDEPEVIVEPVEEAEEVVEPVEEADDAEEEIEAEASDEPEEVVESVEDADDAQEEIEAEAFDEPEEVVESVEDADEDETAPYDTEKSEEEIDIMSTIMALEAGAVAEHEEAVPPQSEEKAVFDELEEVDEEAVEEAVEEDSTEEEAETADETDEDDYLDYDDTARPKKSVSGKAALITMLVTAFVTIGIIVGVVWFALTVNKDIGVTVVSYSDKFNACDTNSFYLGQVMGVSFVSMSDEECTLSAEEISALKKGETVTKFNKMMNLKAETRFGKIVSMDISFNPELNQQKESSMTCMILLGNAMSGLMEGIDSSDKAFIEAYKALVEASVPAPQKGDKVYVYKVGNVAMYTDYSKMSVSNDFADLKVHIEHSEPKYIDAGKLDFSWLPFDLSSDKKSDSAAVSQSDN